jgi:hypothetical protein
MCSRGEIPQKELVIRDKHSITDCKVLSIASLVIGLLLRSQSPLADLDIDLLSSKWTCRLIPRFLRKVLSLLKIARYVTPKRQDHTTLQPIKTSAYSPWETQVSYRNAGAYKWGVSNPWQFLGALCQFLSNSMEQSSFLKAMVCSFSREVWVKNNHKISMQQGGEWGAGRLYSSASRFQSGHAVQSRTQKCCQVHLTALKQLIFFG